MIKISKVTTLVVIAGSSLLFTNFTYAEDTQDTRITISGKMWSQTWNAWNYLSVNGSNATPAGTTVQAGDPSSILLGGITVKNGNYFVSANKSMEQNVNFAARSNQTVKSFNRAETDINVGYYLHPQVGISLGKKYVDYNYGTGVTNYDFLTIGLNASAKIDGTSFFMYGNGAMSLSGASNSNPAWPGVGWSTDTPTYRSVEAGLGYILSKNVTMTAGYKYQQIQLPLSYTLASTWYNVGAVNTSDTATGFIIGAAYTF